MLGAFVPVALKDAGAHEAGVANAVKTARLLAAVASAPKPYLVLADNNGTVPERTRNAGRITPGWVSAPLNGAPSPKARIASEEPCSKKPDCEPCSITTAPAMSKHPDEIARFLELTDPAAVGLVFDTGHYAYGAGHLRCDSGPRTVTGTGSSTSI